MDEKRKEGYIAGVICLLIFAVFLSFSWGSAWNQSSQLMWIFTLFFGGLGAGSIWKPEVIGEVASQILKNIAKNTEESSSSVTDKKQIQNNSPGAVQTMAHNVGTMNIYSGKDEKNNDLKDKICQENETIHISPKDSCFYPIKLKKGDYLKGEISSDVPLDIYLLDVENYARWEKDKSFNEEYSTGSILTTKINHQVPKRGTWYLVLENNGRKAATTKVIIY